MRFTQMKKTGSGWARCVAVSMSFIHTATLSGISPPVRVEKIILLIISFSHLAQTKTKICGLVLLVQAYGIGIVTKISSRRMFITLRTRNQAAAILSQES